MIQIFQNLNVKNNLDANKELYYKDLLTLIGRFRIKLYFQNPLKGGASQIIEYKDDKIAPKENYFENVIKLRSGIDLGQTFTFKELIFLKFDDIESFLSTHTNPRIKIYSDYACKNEFDFFTKVYESYRTNKGYEFVKYLELQVCPYCNRTYINDTEKSTHAEFDHFFPKSHNEIFAATFENLVPCCHSCNHDKSDDITKKLISPYDQRYRTDQILTFGYKSISIDKREIIINKMADDFEGNIESFHLLDVYNKHVDILDETILKCRKYNKAYVDSLKSSKEFSFKTFLTPEEIYYGAPMREDKYYLRPLSKFIHDVVDQVNKELHEK